MESNKKICFFVGSLCQGGAERDVTIIANRLVADGYSVTIVLVFKNQIFFELDKRINIVDWSNKFRNRKLFTILKLGKTIKKFHAENNFDYYLGNMIGLNCLIIKSLRKTNAKFIARIVSDPQAWGWKQKYFSKRLYPKAYKVVAQTKYQIDGFDGKLDKNYVVIPNICDYQIAIDAKKNYSSRCCIYVGRLNVNVKRLDLLIEGFNVFRKKHDDFKLLLFGEYPDDNGYSKGIIENTIEKLNASKHVYIKGPTKNVMEELQKAFCFVFSSPHEGMPNAILESQLIGVPVITSHFDGVEYIISDNNDGLIYNFGNIDELAQKIELLYDDESLYRKLSDEGIKRKALYREDRIIELFKGVFK